MLFKAAVILIIVLTSSYLLPKILKWRFNIAIDKAKASYDFIIGIFSYFTIGIVKTVFSDQIFPGVFSAEKHF